MNIGEIFAMLMSCVAGIGTVHTVPLTLDLDSFQFMQPKHWSSSDLSKLVYPPPPIPLFKKLEVEFQIGHVHIGEIQHQKLM